MKVKFNGVLFCFLILKVYCLQAQLSGPVKGKRLCPLLLKRKQAQQKP